jgi:hypothetical protein
MGGGSANVTRLGGLEIAGAELKKLSGAALIERLLASGFSRLGAENGGNRTRDGRAGGGGGPRAPPPPGGARGGGGRPGAPPPGDEATGALMGVIFSEMSSV